MLHIITSTTDPLTRLLKDDPVRPEIPVEFRISEHTQVFVLQHDETHEPLAVVCAAYRDYIPANVTELAQAPELTPKVAVFYTIWSYHPGAGRKLITQTKNWLLQNQTNITEFVTLSPPTDMARTFHLRNGAGIFRVNTDTVNYQYS